MNPIRRLAIASIAALLLAVVAAQFFQTVPAAKADTGLPEGPRRQTNLNINLTRYEWFMVRWSNNALKCRILVDHAGVPTSDEILTACGLALHDEWKDTPPCNVDGDTSTCAGMYLQPLRRWPIQRQVEVKLPEATVWLDLNGCQLGSPQNTCNSLPELVLKGEEPLPNETIVRLQGSVDGEAFSCAGSACTIPLHPTGQQGQVVEFWADSSFGDSSKRYTALVRVTPWGDFANPEASSNDPTLYYVDILSSQWRGAVVSTCQDVWKVFPDIGGPPPWLASPLKAQDLTSDISYYYLAGMLIQNGIVDASECENYGIQSRNVANACGVEAAQPEIRDWQNRFDTEIFQAAQDTGVPAQLLKNIFSRESQFWPGIFDSYKEAGLGSMTDNGADAALLWNRDFFDQFCPLMLDRSVCQLGFGNLKDTEQALLRGALVRSVNADCPNCPVGVDLSQANFSVNIFAQSLVGNCTQVSQILYNLTGKDPGQVSSYVDLWKFTLVNYNAGSGCLTSAVKRALAAGQALSWENVIRYLDPACKTAVDYVNDISAVAAAQPTPTPWVVFSGGEAVNAQALSPTIPPPGYTPSAPTPTIDPYAPTATPEEYIDDRDITPSPTATP